MRIGRYREEGTDHMVRAKYGVPETMHGHVMTRLMGKAMCKQGAANLEMRQRRYFAVCSKNDAMIRIFRFRNIADVKHYVGTRRFYRALHGEVEGKERISDRCEKKELMKRNEQKRIYDYPVVSARNMIQLWLLTEQCY